MRFFTTALSLLPFLTPVFSAPFDQLVDLEERAASTALTNVKLPSSGLPAPPAGLVLRWIGLGYGTQNYSCATADASAVPTSNGAVADLYDISSVNDNRGRLAWMLPSLPATALSMAAFGGKPSVEAFLSRTGFNKNLGAHFFNQTMVPCFFLTGLKNPIPAPELFAKKVANVPAPDLSCKGTNSEGAIDWLFLEDLGNSISGVKAVYRVYTAGGKAPATCAGQEANIDVPYTAQYWFYGLP